jgi:hypothetical protein
VTEYHAVALVWVKRGSVGSRNCCPVLPDIASWISLRGFHAICGRLRRRVAVLPLYLPPSPPLLPDRRSPSLPAQGGEGGRGDAQIVCRSTQLTTTPRVHPPSLVGPSPPLAPRSTLAIPTCPRGRRAQSLLAHRRWHRLGVIGPHLLSKARNDFLESQKPIQSFFVA